MHHEVRDFIQVVIFLGIVATGVALFTVVAGYVETTIRGEMRIIIGCLRALRDVWLGFAFLSWMIGGGWHDDPATVSYMIGAATLFGPSICAEMLAEYLEKEEETDPRLVP